MPDPVLQAGYHPDDRLLSFREVAELVGLQASATKALVRRPGFPPVVRLSQRTPRWWRMEVLRWLEAHRTTYSTTSFSTGYCAATPRRRPQRAH
jgi:predicted DNA-binding transcriptional regulator AlpA